MLVVLCAASLFSCNEKTVLPNQVRETLVNVGTHDLMTYTIIKDSKYLVVFESGLGNGHESWNPSGNTNDLMESSDLLQSDVLLYDRAGYGKSDHDSSPRNINQLRTELEKVINQFSNGRKIILVGHSLGGLIIRDYAIKNPAQVAGLLFVDPTHENFNQLTQSMEDQVYELAASAYGASSGDATEARQLIEDLQYTSTLPNLLNIPVIVLTSMKEDEANKTAEAFYHKTRQDWYNAHELLGKGVTDFTHIATTKSGHYIHQEEPELLLDNLKLLLSK